MKASLLLFMMVGALLAYLSTRVLALNEGTGTTEASVEEVSSPVVPLHEVVRLEPSDADMGFGEGFGLASVGIDGDWIVVGAPYDDENVERSGASYVFRRAGPTWVQHSKLKGLPLADTMGFSLATDGDWIVAGAPSMNSFPGWPAAGLGRAYVFQRDDQGTPDDLTDDRWDARAVCRP